MKGFIFFIVSVSCLLFLNFCGWASGCDKAEVCRMPQTQWSAVNINIQTWQMENGARLYFVRRPQLPVVDIEVLFDAGSVFDGNNWGLAAMTNSMIGEGTTTRDANQIAVAFDAVGAEFSTNADRDMATISLRSLAAQKYLQPALNVFADVINHAVFPDRSFQRIKNQTFAAIKIGQQQIGTIAENAFFQEVYKNLPYAHPSLGILKTVASIDKVLVESFYHQYYVAKNAKIVIVGDVTFSQAKKMAQEVVGLLPVGEKAHTFKKIALEQAPLSKHINYPAKQTAIIIGQLGITRKNPDYFPLIVGNAVLGGLPLTSVLFEQVREQRGLAYFADSAFFPLKYRGVFQIQLKTRIAKTQESLQVVKQVLAEFVKNGPGDKHLAAAKQNLIGSFPLTLSTNKNILAVVSNIAFYDRPLDYLNTYRNHISQVTSQQIKSAFQKIIQINKMVTITVGPKRSE